MELNNLNVEKQKKSELEEIKDIENLIYQFRNSLKYWQDTSKIQNLINELAKMIEIQNNSSSLEAVLERIINFFKYKSQREEERERKRREEEERKRLEEEERKKKEEAEKLKKIKKIMVKFEPYLKELYGKIIINEDEKKYNIDLLISDEINKKIKNLDKIILINEENSKILFYDLINKYINVSLNEKNILFDDNILDFIKIFNILIQEEKISDISLINSFNEWGNNYIDRKFFILNKEKFKDIYPEAENIEIYYFKYNNKSYVYFKKDQVIVEINKDNDYNQNGLFKLNKYEITELELLKYINLKIANNKKLLKNPNFKINNYINECYIINSNYILSYFNCLKNKYVYRNLEDFEPFNIKSFNGEYPINFEILEKNKFQKVIDTLITNFNYNNILARNVLFVNEVNSIDYENEKKYFGIEDKKKLIIYFYSFNNDKYLFEFSLDYNDFQIYNYEKENILKKGIIAYLNEKQIYPNIGNYKNYLIKGEKENLYNVNGFYKKKTMDKLKKLSYSKGLEFDYSDNFNEIILCLINLEPFKDYFLGKNFKLDKHHIISYYFYKIMNDLLYDNYDEDKIIYIDFKENIKQKINLKSNKILFDFILKNLHNESVSLVFGGPFGSENRLEESCYTKSESIFQQNFFFKLYFEKNCSNSDCKFKECEYYYDCTLEIYLNINENQKILNINDLLEIKMNENQVCMNVIKKKGNKECLNIANVKKMFKSRPNFLIILINKNKQNVCEFEINEEINLSKYKTGIKKEFNLELVCFKCNKKLYCKIADQNKNFWVLYEGKKKCAEINKVNKIPDIPDFLIYKKK